MAEAGGAAAKLVAAIHSRAAPRAARLAAARGALPLAPAELVELQLLLSGDEDAEISAAAARSLADLSRETAHQIVLDPDVGAAAMAYLSAECSRWPAVAVQLASSTRIAPEALRPIAHSSLPDALAAMVRNETALSLDEELGRILKDNPALPATARTRLLDFLDELAKRTAAAAGAPEIAPAAPLAPARDPFLAALGVDAEVEALLPTLGLDLGQLQERSELLGEAEDDDEARLLKRLGKMTVGQKLRVALFGGRMERAILVRDSNRIIAAAVLKNPQFSPDEAESVAASRNVAVDILRLIASRQEFAKLYSVQHRLVRNPRCPPQISMPLVARLAERDLKLLVKNRNVPEAVRLQAKKIIDTREARQKVRFSPGKH